MPLGESLSELRRQHRDLCRNHVYPRLVESLRTGDLQRAKSQAGLLGFEFQPTLNYPYEVQDRSVQSAIREAELILREARQRGTDGDEK